MGRDYVACANARKLGTCDQKTSFRSVTLEEAVLHLLRDRLMQPDAVGAFVAEFGEEMNAQSGIAAAERQRLSAERTSLARKLDGLYEAIAEGLRTPGLKEKLLALETELGELDAKLAAQAPSPIRLHPNLAELYRKKVADLAATLADPALRQPALELIRSLITRVTLRVTDDRPVLELEGALCAMINSAQPGGLGGVVDRSVEVVAGARNRRYLPRVIC